MKVPGNGGKLDSEQQDQLLFMMQVQQYQQIAMMGMGKVKNPATDKVERDLSSAKYAIDTLNMLQKYTAGNLPKELKDYLNQTLTNLRLNYADEKQKGEQTAAKTEMTDEDRPEGNAEPETETGPGEMTEPEGKSGPGEKAGTGKNTDSEEKTGPGKAAGSKGEAGPGKNTETGDEAKTKGGADSGGKAGKQKNSESGDRSGTGKQARPDDAKG